ncbi:OLC1v1008728C4 [Oldenlandia corymbosa var. corymbosa]|nr:OLC1v1008728C4 [Oldenlandia corymbosa var. corymbosa]
MRSFRALRVLSSTISLNSQKSRYRSALVQRFYSAETQPELSSSSTEGEDENSSSVFDSSHFDSDSEKGGKMSNPNWDEKHRDRLREVFGEEIKNPRIARKEEKKNNAARLAMFLLHAAVQQDEHEEEDGGKEKEVKLEDQKSLHVGIIGAPNAGKSALTNYMVGTKVAAVSRKMNTTTHEVLGVMTKGVTQICFFDTPGLMLRKSGFPYNDIKVRMESAWSSISLFDVLLVIFDVDRHIKRPDSRVVRLIQRMGSQVNPNQKRILCMNKVDLVEKQKDLLKVAEEFKDLPGYERHFMISGLKGSGVKELTQYLIEQAVEKPWEEDPFTLTEEIMKRISLEVVREKLLHHVHQEIPYNIEHRLMDWKELRDGSLRIEQHFITHKMSQRKILVGKNGSKIGRIGLEANEELRSIFKKNVHLVLMVRVK